MAGMGSVRMTLPAASCPEFVTVRVYSRVSPGKVLLPLRSATVFVATRFGENRSMAVVTTPGK